MFFCSVFTRLVVVGGIVVHATKRPREEVDEDINAGTTEYPTEEFSRLLNSLSGRSENFYDALISGVQTPLHDDFRRLGRLEVEAFHILVSEEVENVEDLVPILNSRIDVSRTLDKRPFGMIRAAVWWKFVREEFLPTLTNDPVAKASFIQQLTRVQTDESSGITFLEFTRTGWSVAVRNALLRIIPNPPVPIMKFEKLTTIRDPREFKNLLTPKAEEFVQYYILKGFDPSSMERILAYFDTTSLLPSLLAEYFMSINTIRRFDGSIILPLITSAPSGTSPEVLAAMINAKFNEANPPRFKILYTPSRVSWLLENPALLTTPILSERMEIIVGKLRYHNGKPNRVKTRDVVGEWEALERSQALSMFYVAPRTELPSKRWNMSFSIPLGKLESRADYPICSLDEPQRASVLKYLSSDQVGFEELENASNVNGVLSRTGISVPRLIEIVSSMKSLKAIPIDLASELARVNKKKINTDAATILTYAKRRGVDTTNISPQHLLSFYRMMLQAVEEKNAVPGLTPYRNEAKTLALIPEEIWRQYIVMSAISDLCL